MFAFEEINIECRYKKNFIKILFYLAIFLFDIFLKETFFNKILIN